MRQLWAKTTTNQIPQHCILYINFVKHIIHYIHVHTLLEQENSTLTSCTSGLRNSSTLFMECSITWPFSSVSSFELFSITSSDILMFLMFCKTHGNTILRHFNFFSFILLTAVKVKKKKPCVSVVVVFIFAFSSKNFNFTHDVHAFMKIPPSYIARKIKGAVSRQSSSFCLILPITCPQSIRCGT